MFKRVVAIVVLAAIIPGCAQDTEFLSRRPPQNASTPYDRAWGEHGP